MIKLRRSGERRHVQRGEHDVWHTFYPEERVSQIADDLGALLAFDEIKVPPGGVWTPRPPEEAEVFMYIYQGALTQEDSTGASGVLHAGEFQHMNAGRGIRHKETNASRTHQAHVFRISLRPTQVGLDCSSQQRRFPAAQRHNLLCAVASLDGRKGSLRILQDTVIYSSVLDPGHHLIHELSPRRSVWLHVVCGEATLQDSLLTEGDGAAVAGEPSVSLTALERTEILLVNLGPVAPAASGSTAP